MKVKDFNDVVEWAYKLYSKRGYNLNPLEDFNEFEKLVLAFEMVGRKKAELVIKEIFNTFGAEVNVTYTSTRMPYDINVGTVKYDEDNGVELTAARGEVKNRMKGYSLEDLNGKKGVFIEPHKVKNTDVFINFTFDNMALIWPISKLHQVDEDGNTRAYNIPKTEMDPNSERQQTIRYFFYIDEAITMRVPGHEEWDRINDILNEAKERIDSEREQIVKDKYLELENTFAIKVEQKTS